MKSIIPNLRVADVAASIRFYEEVLGFTTVMTLPGEEGGMVHAALQRGAVSLMFGPLDSPWGTISAGDLGKGVVFYVSLGDDEDLDALFAHARAAGATVVQEPTDQFWGDRDWGIADPDGYQIFVSKQTREMSGEQMLDAMMTGAAG